QVGGTVWRNDRSPRAGIGCIRQARDNLAVGNVMERQRLSAKENGSPAELSWQRFGAHCRVRRCEVIPEQSDAILSNRVVEQYRGRCENDAIDFEAIFSDGSYGHRESAVLNPQIMMSGSSCGDTRA